MTQPYTLENVTVTMENATDGLINFLDENKCSITIGGNDGSSPCLLPSLEGPITYSITDCSNNCEDYVIKLDIVDQNLLTKAIAKGAMIEVRNSWNENWVVRKFVGFLGDYKSTECSHICEVLEDSQHVAIWKYARTIEE